MPEETQVDNTVQYLVEQVKEAVTAGVPVASAFTQEILNQIHNYGIMQFVFSVILLLVSALLGYLFTKCVKIGANSCGDSVEKIYMLATVVTGVATPTFFFISLTEMHKSLVMVFAPMVWIIQSLH